MEKELTLHEHLEELRWRILVVVSIFIVFSIVAFRYSSLILDYLMLFTGPLVFIAPTEMFMSLFKITFLLALIPTLPVLLYQAAAYCTTSKGKALKYSTLGSTLFLLGAVFGAIVLPMTLRFFVGFSTQAVQPTLSVGNVIGYSTGLIAGFGVLFLLPILLHAIVGLGLMSKKQLEQSRAYVFITILVLSAFFTPPDVISQLLAGVPLYLLFEITLLTLPKENANG